MMATMADIFPKWRFWLPIRIKSSLGSILAKKILQSFHRHFHRFLETAHLRSICRCANVCKASSIQIQIDKKLHISAVFCKLGLAVAHFSGLANPVTDLGEKSRKAHFLILKGCPASWAELAKKSNFDIQLQWFWPFQRSYMSADLNGQLFFWWCQWLRHSAWTDMWSVCVCTYSYTCV